MFMEFSKAPHLDLIQWSVNISYYGTGTRDVHNFKSVQLNCEIPLYQKRRYTEV